jgi:hypothetical protein
MDLSVRNVSAGSADIDFSSIWLVVGLYSVISPAISVRSAEKFKIVSITAGRAINPEV